MAPRITILCAGPLSWASSRFRGHWLAQADPETFAAAGPGDELPDLDQCEWVVYQKRHSPFDIEQALRLKKGGVKIGYDLTDPMWIWRRPDVDRMMGIADLVTVSSHDLQHATQQRYPDVRVEVVPDTMLPSFHPDTAPLDPLGGDKKAYRFVWFGMANNRAGLIGALPEIEDLSWDMPIIVRVIDDAPEQRMTSGAPLRFEHVVWKLDTFHEHLTGCDMALCPPYPGWWGRLKSDNKRVTAWWAGLPVWGDLSPQVLTAANIIESFERVTTDASAYRDPVTWRATGEALRRRAEQHHHIGIAVAKWKEIVDA